MTRKIAVVTAGMADFALIEPLTALDGGLVLVACGDHLSPAAGRTETVLAGRGLSVAHRVDSRLSSCGPVARAKALGMAIAGFADAFAGAAPDLVVVAGFEPEMLAAAQTCMVMRLPLAHVHAAQFPGDRIGQAIAASITKLAQLHFVPDVARAERCRRLGEQPDKVFVGGDMVEILLNHPLDGLVVKPFNDILE